MTPKEQSFRPRAKHSFERMIVLMLSHPLSLLRTPRHLKLLPTNEALQLRLKLVRPPRELLLPILLARLDAFSRRSGSTDAPSISNINVLRPL